MFRYLTTLRLGIQKPEILVRLQFVPAEAVPVDDGAVPVLGVVVLAAGVVEFADDCNV